jgi:hypothetical protein
MFTLFAHTASSSQSNVCGYAWLVQKGLFLNRFRWRLFREQIVATNVQPEYLILCCVSKWQNNVQVILLKHFQPLKIGLIWESRHSAFSLMLKMALFIKTVPQNPDLKT